MLVPVNYNDDVGNALLRSLSLEYDHLTNAYINYIRFFAVCSYKVDIVSAKFLYKIVPNLNALFCLI